jgi:hypothetical protein
MYTRTGAFIAEQRRAQRLNPQELASRVGYQNLGKGGNRILALERDGVTVPGLLDKIISVLELDPDHVRALVEEDRQEFQDAWERWINEPVEPELRRRLIPATWGRIRMPEGLSREGAVEFAKTRAVEERLTYLLIPSRREEVWCYPSGRIYVRPMTVGDVQGGVTHLRGRGGRGFVFG